MRPISCGEDRKQARSMAEDAAGFADSETPIPAIRGMKDTGPACRSPNHLPDCLLRILNRAGAVSRSADVCRKTGTGTGQPGLCGRSASAAGRRAGLSAGWMRAVSPLGNKEKSAGTDPVILQNSPLHTTGAPTRLPRQATRMSARAMLCPVAGNLSPCIFSGTTHLVVAHIFLGAVFGTAAAVFMFFQVGLLWAMAAYVTVGSTAMLTLAAARWFCRSPAPAEWSEDAAADSHGIIHPAQAAKTLRNDSPRCGEADRDRRAAKESGHIQCRIPDRRIQRASSDREAARGR